MTVRGGGARVPVVALFAAFSATMAYSFFLELQFSADGAHYFASILDTGRVGIPGKMRAFADVAAQWPLVLALRAGVHDLGASKVLFVLGLWLPFLASFLLSAYALRGVDRDALVFPLVGFALVSMPAAYIWTAESHVLACAVWPVLFLLLRPSLTRADGLLLAGLMAFLVLTYETVVGAAALFIAILAVRLPRSSGEQRFYFACALAVAVVLVVANSYSIAFPRSLRNRESFIGGLLEPLSHPSFLCGVAAFSLLAIGAATTRRVPLVLAVIAAGGSVLLPFLGFTASAYTSFTSRTLTGTMLPLLLLTATLWTRPRAALAVGDAGSFDEPRAGMRVVDGPWTGARRFDAPWVWACAAVFVLYFLGSALSWNEWSRFRSDFRRVLAAERGYVALESTPLHGDNQRWGWTLPLMSILWSDGCVRTIVLNRVGAPWQPYDPKTHLPLQRYFAFSPELKAAAPHAADCE